MEEKKPMLEKGFAQPDPNFTLSFITKYTATPICTHLSWISVLIVALICYVRLQDPAANEGFVGLIIFIYSVGAACLFCFVFAFFGMLRQERLVILRWVLLAIPLIIFGFVFIAA